MVAINFCLSIAAGSPHLTKRHRRRQNCYYHTNHKCTDITVRQNPSLSLSCYLAECCVLIEYKIREEERIQSMHAKLLLWLVSGHPILCYLAVAIQITWEA